MRYMETKNKYTPSTNIRLTDNERDMIEKMKNLLPHPPGERVTNSAVVRAGLRLLWKQVNAKKKS
jgi:Arc/MetJ-type ribon-helix-helix transcriptional regulator